MFSLIIPTRDRVEQLGRLLDSLVATTSRRDELEVILVVDEDDTATRAFAFEGLTVKQVAVEPGLPMGTLNMRGYEAASGDRLMLMNDDVVVKTPGWDQRVTTAFNGFPDGVVLVHVNDGTFKERLCVFPFITRAFAELAGGICPVDYVRYRIDDHIYNVFNLLAHLGERRILYLPDVVFEHRNYSGWIPGYRMYLPNQEIHDADTDLYVKLFDKRKNLALSLKARIDARRSALESEKWESRLSRLGDPLLMRDPRHIRVSPDSVSPSSDSARITIGVVTADLRSDHARHCIANIKKFTRNYELVIVDNGRAEDFNHAREMNWLIDKCRSDYLVLMDDDVFVEPGWADGLLRCITSKVGVVTPVHNDSLGRFSYAGVVMYSDHSGGHEHILEKPDAPRKIMTLCSAIMLIDLSKCGHLRLDESYTKYFLDIDFGLRIWEAGYEVVCSPYSKVTHVGGATLGYGTSKANALLDAQRQYFVEKWITPGRYQQLEDGIWKREADIQPYLSYMPDVGPRLDVIEEYKAHSIVFHERYYGISTAYRILTARRIEYRDYRRMVEGETIDEVKRRIDRLVYPTFLLHARIIVYRAKSMRRRAVFFLQRLARSGMVCGKTLARKIVRVLGRIAGPLLTSILQPAVQKNDVKRTNPDE